MKDSAARQVNAQATHVCTFCGEHADHKCGQGHACGRCCSLFGTTAGEPAHDWIANVVEPQLRMLRAASVPAPAPSTQEELEKLVDERYHQKLSRIPHVPPAKKTLRGDTYREIAIEFARKALAPVPSEARNAPKEKLLKQKE